MAVTARKTRRPKSGPPPAPLGPERVEDWPDGDWVVRQVPGAAFAPGLTLPDDAAPLEEILALLGRRPSWSR